MNSRKISLLIAFVPVIACGLTSCASMDQARTRLAEWKEKREEQRMARELALAEKQIAEEAAEGGPTAPTGMEDSIFLDYSNPGGSLIEGGSGAVASSHGQGMGMPALPGSELPVVMDWAATGDASMPSEDSVFLVGSGGSESLAAGPLAGVNPDLVRAWASSISPIMGASLTEPLITAAMTARVTPTETAVAAHAATTDSAPLASAFAGQPVRTDVHPATSELEHQ